MFILSCASAQCRFSIYYIIKSKFLLPFISCILSLRAATAFFWRAKPPKYVVTTLLNAPTQFMNECSFFHQMAYRLTYFIWLTFSDRLAYFGVPIVHAFWACLQCTRLFCSSTAACIHRVHGRTFNFFSINWKGTEKFVVDLNFRFDIQTRSNSNLSACNYGHRSIINFILVSYLFLPWLSSELTKNGYNFGYEVI